MTFSKSCQPERSADHNRLSNILALLPVPLLKEGFTGWLIASVKNFKIQCQTTVLKIVFL